MILLFSNTLQQTHTHAQYCNQFKQPIRLMTTSSNVIQVLSEILSLIFQAERFLSFDCAEFSFEELQRLMGIFLKSNVATCVFLSNERIIELINGYIIHIELP